MTDCIFCDIVSKEIPASVVFENEFVIAFLDTYPSNLGHTLLTPKVHYSSFEQLPGELSSALSKALGFLAPKVAAAVEARAFNLLLNNGKLAGQVIRHLHWHIVPRYANDGLKGWPNKKATPEQLQIVADNIKKHL